MKIFLGSLVLPVKEGKIKSCPLDSLSTSTILVKARQSSHPQRGRTSERSWSKGVQAWLVCWIHVLSWGHTPWSRACAFTSQLMLVPAAFLQSWGKDTLVLFCESNSASEFSACLHCSFWSLDPACMINEKGK